MRISLFIVFLFSFLGVNSQIFEKLYQSSAQFPINGGGAHVYDTLNGAVILSGSTQNYKGNLIKVNTSGDTVWRKIINYKGGRGYNPEGFLKMNNGDIHIVGYSYEPNNAILDNRVIIRKYDSNGNYIGYDSTVIGLNPGVGISCTEPDSNGDYYYSYHNDSIIASSSTNTSFSQVFEKRSQSGNVLWTKAFTYVGSPVPDSAVFGRCLGVNKDNSFWLRWSYSGMMISNFQRIEKYSSGGVLQYTLDPTTYYPGISPDYMYTYGMTSLKDSSIVFTMQRGNNFSNTVYHCALIRISKTGALLDSMSFYNVFFDQLTETRNGELVGTYQTMNPNNQTGTSGVVFMSKQFGVRQYFPLLFGNGVLGTGKLSPNNKSGAFFSFPTNQDIFVASFDSLFNTYPNELNGDISLDNDKNCIASAPDYSINQGLVKAVDALNNTFATFSNPNGSCKLKLPTSSFTVTHVTPANKNVNCSNAVGTLTTTGNTTVTTNYKDTLIPNLKDVVISTFLSGRKPGDTTSASIYFKNVGSNTVTQTMKYVMDTSFTFIWSSPTITAQVGDTLYYSINSLKPDSFSNVLLLFNISASLPLGSTIKTKAIFNQASDLTPWNNIDSVSKIASLTSPKNVTINPGFNTNSLQVNKPLYFDGNEELTYKINYQNRSGYLAKDLIVIDSLDKNIDINSLKLIYSKHTITNLVVKNRAVILKFKQCNIPDSSQSPNHSKGEIVFSVKAKQGLPVNTPIFNSALTLFDIYESVETNKTLNRIKGYDVGVKEFVNVKKESFVKLFPNPTNEYCYVYSGEKDLQKVALYDLAGRKLMEVIEIQGNILDLDTKEILSGVYIIQTTVENKVYTNKLVITK
jgi:hypothetical protein